MFSPFHFHHHNATNIKLHSFFSSVSIMRSFLTILLTLLLSAAFMSTTVAADKSLYVGKWKIVETYDEQLAPVALPEGDFYMELSPNDNDEDDDSLNAYMKIGNNMRTKIVFSASGGGPDGDEISVGDLMSTMMMPPEPLFKLETYLSNTLPKMNLVQKQKTEGGITMLTFTGLGKIVCQATDSEE